MRRVRNEIPVGQNSISIGLADHQVTITRPYIKWLCGNSTSHTTLHVAIRPWLGYKINVNPIHKISTALP